MRPVLQGGRRVRVASGEEEEVRVRLTRVAEGHGAEVPDPLRHAAGEQRRPPAEERHHVDGDRVRGREEKRRDREEEAEQRHDAALRLRRIDLEVDGIAPGGADEARERAADEEEEGADVHPVPDPGGEEAVEGRRHAADRERDHPHDDREEERDDATTAAAR